MSNSDRELPQFVYEPLKTSRNIRLLRVSVSSATTAQRQTAHAPTENANRTSYELVEVPLSTCSDTYEAVSYAWGNTTQSHSLQINGQYQLPITETLATALPYLTKPCSTGYLWIDQICINQSDLQERGQQVSLMGEIYSGALRVLVWTGSEIKGFSVAMSRSSKLNERSRYKSLSKRHRKAIDGLFGQSWFRRGWVIQEAVMAKSITFVSGNCAFSAADLSSAQRQTYNGIEYGVDSMTFKGYCAFSSIMVLRGRSTHEIDESFDQLLVSFAENKTSDLRDQVYAFLGLARDPRILINPDYGAPVSIVYSDTARAIIEGTNSLEIFQWLPRLKADSLGLPSWVPNWSDPNKNWIPLISPFYGEESKRMNAANGRLHKMKYSPGIDTTILKISGRVVDHPYRRLPNPYYFICGTIDRNIKITSAFWRRTMFSTLRNSGSTSSRMFNWTDAEVLAIAPSGKTDFTRTLQRRLISILLPDFENPDDIIDLYNGERHSISKHQYYKKTFPGWVNYELWYTKAGKFALLIPDVCEESDAIAIIDGSKAPVLLGKGVGNTYTVKGLCYLEDAMHGEAVTWEEDEADVLELS